MKTSAKDPAFASQAVHLAADYPAARLSLKGPATTSSEPILFPKLQIYCADFPYLHSSIDQRLLTLET
jgi:hypothetical protein